MQHDDYVYLGHMLDTARKVVAKVQGRRREELDSDEDVRVVLTHWVQIIGEAAAHVSNDMRRAHPNVPWKRIIGMRHRIVHDYLNIDVDALWEVATTGVPDLIRDIEAILPPDLA